MKSSETHMDLVGRYLSGQATPEESAALEKLMLEDPQLRADFLACARVDAALPEAVGEKMGLVELTPSVAAKAGWLRWLPTEAAAALLILTGVLFWLAQNGSDTPSVTALTEKAEAMDDGVAVLALADEVDWRGDAHPEVDDILAPGALRIAQGVLEIEFYSGARLVVEGPADIELVSDERVICRQGGIRAIVPPAARGFTVVAPQFELVDLGTEFGLSVDSASGSRVQVFDGEVELYSPGERDARPAAEKLLKGDGLIWNDAGSQPWREPDPKAFPSFDDVAARRAKIAERRLEKWTRWNADVEDDPRIAFHFDFESEGSSLRDRGPLGQHGDIVGAESVSGRWASSRALEFKRPGDRVRIDLPGEFDALTLSTWIRIDALPNRSQGLLLTDGYEVGRLHWHVSRDATLRLGVRKPSAQMRDGATGYGSPPVFTPRKVGTWSFLCTVYDREAGTVRHYVNGKEVSAHEVVYDQPLQIGAGDIGNWIAFAKRGSRYVRNLTGRIDELTVWNTALSGKEIRKIYLNTRP